MDPDLVKRSQRGDERAFEALTIRAHPRLFRVAFGILRDADGAESATQQAFIDIWRFMRRLGDRSRFEAWSYRVLIDVCRTQDRERLDPGVPMESIAASEAGAGDPFGTVVDRSRLAGGFARLSTDDRAVLVLRFLADLSAEDLALALDTSPQKVDARLQAALTALDEALDEDALLPIGLAPHGEVA